MGTQQANAQWTGNLKQGNGKFTLPKANLSANFSFSTRFENGDGTNPEELVGAALASCYSMFLSALLSNNGFESKQIQTEASVTLDRDETGPVITKIFLDVTADVVSISDDDFQGYVNEAIQKCPISRLYATVEKRVDARLLTSAT